MKDGGEQVLKVQVVWSEEGKGERRRRERGEINGWRRIRRKGGRKGRRKGENR